MMDDSYELAVDLPGFKKDEINLDIKDGYLTVSAEKGLDKKEEDKKGRILRQERYAGVCSRSFYVGDVKPEDVKAKSVTSDQLAFVQQRLRAALVDLAAGAAVGRDPAVDIAHAVLRAAASRCATYLQLPSSWHRPVRPPAWLPPWWDPA